MTKLKYILGAGLLAAGSARPRRRTVAAAAARRGPDADGRGEGGNAAGTIPAWNGGLKSAADAGAPGFKSGGHHPGPVRRATSRSTRSTPSNIAKYAANLTAGHKALLAAYKGSYFMNVYPSHRSAAFPQRIYDAVKANAPPRS